VLETEDVVVIVFIEHYFSFSFGFFRVLCGPIKTNNAPATHLLPPPTSPGESSISRQIMSHRSNM